MKPTPENNVHEAVQALTRWLRQKPRRPYSGPFAGGCWGATEPLPDARSRSLREALAMAYQLGYARGAQDTETLTRLFTQAPAVFAINEETLEPLTARSAMRIDWPLES